MDHSYARQIFEEIQARPYQLSCTAGEPCDNCFYKGVEVIQKLGALGYTVRGRLAESYWDSKIFPAEVFEKLPQDIPLTHFYPEILLDGEWRIIDPSFPPSLKKYGFPIGSWDAPNLSCFPLTRIFSQEESIQHQLGWHCTSKESSTDCSGSCWKPAGDWITTLA